MKSNYDSDDAKQVKDMFIEAGIPARLHFTKLGYYKLYKEMKFWYAHYTQIAAFIVFCFAVYYLARVAIESSSLHQSSVFTCLAIAASLQCASEFLVGDLSSALKMFLGATAFLYILINFI